MTIQDWGITYDELEPHYDRFEYLCGTSGTAGNLQGKIMEGGNPFEGPRSRSYPTPAQAQPYSHTLFGKAAREIGLQAVSAAFRQSLAGLYQSAWACRWGRAPIAASASGSAAATIRKQARRPRSCLYLIRKPNFSARDNSEVVRINTRPVGQARHRRHLRRHQRRRVGAAGGPRDPVGVLAVQRATPAAFQDRHSPTTPWPIAA